MRSEFKFRNLDGKAVGTQGWQADHDKASCLTYTGLWCGKKVVALLVARGDYDQQRLDLNANGEFIVRACNAHDDLMESLQGLADIIESAGVENLVKGVQLGQVSWLVKANDRIAQAKAALAKARA